MNLNKLLIDLMKGKGLAFTGTDEELQMTQEVILHFLKPVQSLLTGKVTTRKATGSLYVWLEPKTEKDVEESVRADLG